MAPQPPQPTTVPDYLGTAVPDQIIVAAGFLSKNLHLIATGSQEESVWNTELLKMCGSIFWEVVN
jgi:hypothetical protein